MANRFSADGGHFAGGYVRIPPVGIGRRAAMEQSIEHSAQ